MTEKTKIIEKCEYLLKIMSNRITVMGVLTAIFCASLIGLGALAGMNIYDENSILCGRVGILVVLLSGIWCVILVAIWCYYHRKVKREKTEWDNKLNNLKKGEKWSYSTLSTLTEKVNFWFGEIKRYTEWLLTDLLLVLLLSPLLLLIPIALTSPEIIPPLGWLLLPIISIVLGISVPIICWIYLHRTAKYQKDELMQLLGRITFLPPESLELEKIGTPKEMKSSFERMSDASTNLLRKLKNIIVYSTIIIGIPFYIIFFCTTWWLLCFPEDLYSIMGVGLVNILAISVIIGSVYSFRRKARKLENELLPKLKILKTNSWGSMLTTLLILVDKLAELWKETKKYTEWTLFWLFIPCLIVIGIFGNPFQDVPYPIASAIVFGVPICVIVVIWLYINREIRKEVKIWTERKQKIDELLDKLLVEA